MAQTYFSYLKKNNTYIMSCITDWCYSSASSHTQCKIYCCLEVMKPLLHLPDIHFIQIYNEYTKIWKWFQRWWMFKAKRQTAANKWQFIKCLHCHVPEHSSYYRMLRWLKALCDKAVMLMGQVLDWTYYLCYHINMILQTVLLLSIWHFKIHTLSNLCNSYVPKDPA